MADGEPFREGLDPVAVAGIVDRPRLYDVLDWTRQPDGVPLPPLDGRLVSPKLEVSSATLEGVEVVLDDEAMR